MASWRTDGVAPRSAWWQAVAGALTALAAFFPTSLQAEGVILKNGTELEGAVAKVTTMVPALAGAAPDNGGIDIHFVDDDLRRTYFAFNQGRQALVNPSAPEVKIKVPNNAAGAGANVLALGQMKVKQPLNDKGHRTITIMLPQGPADISQAVTLITSRYYLFQTLPVGQRLLINQPYAISNLTGKQLTDILNFAVKDQKPEVRKIAVRLLLQADRFAEANAQIELLMAQFPQMEGLADLREELRQVRATTAMTALRRLQEAGQPARVHRMLANFPKEGVDGAILLQVREMVAQDMDVQQQMEALRTELKQRMEQIKDASHRGQLEPIIREITGDLTLANLPRLSAYRRLAGDAAMRDADKLALAVSGWLLGADEAMPNLARAQSLIAVRGYIREFLGEPLKANRDALLGKIRSQEAGTAQLVAKLLAAMKPVGTLPEAADSIAGFYKLTVAGREKEPDTEYVVQLPPEYDPYRRYPAVVTLHGQNTTPAQQVDWWAGMANERGQREGQASRQGYIVIAPQWAQQGQRQYEYSQREHLAVLNALRDACRRFAIDTDRVYLSGHMMGGDAAWDLALAHPDLWAGVVPIAAMADVGRFNYIKLYWPNAQSVPLYFVGGEYDATKRAKNGPVFDRYFRAAKCDTMVVEFLGRGPESFSDEIVRIFDWMRRHKRNFFPKDFECVTLRTYDNFFWWIEINKFQPGVTVDPEEWPGRGPRPVRVNGKITVTPNFTMVSAAAGKGDVTIWLAPEMVDFNKRIRVSLTGRPEVSAVRPEVGVILDDARTRGDRQHPFWARVDFD